MNFLPTAIGFLIYILTFIIGFSAASIASVSAIDKSLKPIIEKGEESLPRTHKCQLVTVPQSQ